MTPQAKQILLVDDEEKLIKSIANRLTMMGFLPVTATSGLEAIQIALDTPIDLAIVDLQMPDMNGLITITKLKEIRPSIKTILLTGHGNEKVRQATESLNSLYFQKDEMAEFWQFIKQLNSDGKVVVIRPAASPQSGEASSGVAPASQIDIHSHSDFIKTDDQKGSIARKTQRSGRSAYPRIVGETAVMQKLRNSIARMAAVDCTVTLRGEAGTGKELAARAIHAGSMRKQQRFLAINCADFSRQELAGQLMGYTSGNLYEAIRTHSGIFSAAEVGTLLIDQIEEMPADMQTQLLSILDAHDSQKTENKMDIRVLVATAADLERRVHGKSFNSGLYEHLKVFELTLPPLRERKDDIPPLCQYFFDKYRRELGKAVDSVAPEVIETLVAYDFPGNVQELEHIIERAVISADGKIIGQEHLPLRFKKRSESPKPLETNQFLTIAELEKRYILEVLEACKGNKSKTAEILGISRAALWRKLKHFKSETPDQ